MGDPKPVLVSSGKELELELAKLAKLFAGKETEANWEQRDKAFTRVRGLLRGGVHEEYGDVFMQGLRQLMDGIYETIHSLRTSLVLTVMALIADLCHALNTSLDPLLEVLLQNLLKACTSTKKLISQAAANAITVLLRNTSYHVRSLNAIQHAILDKNAQLRAFAAGFIKAILEAHGNSRYDAIVRSGGVDIIDKCLRRGVADANPAARETSRESFQLYWELWQDRAQAILGTVDPATKKQLIRQLGKLYTAATQGISVPPRANMRPSSRASTRARAPSALGKHVLTVTTDGGGAEPPIPAGGVTAATDRQHPSTSGRGTRSARPSTPSAPLSPPPTSPRRPPSRVSTNSSYDGRPQSPAGARRTNMGARANAMSPQPPLSPTSLSSAAARRMSVSPPPTRQISATRSSSPGGTGSKRPMSPTTIGRRSHSVAPQRMGATSSRRPGSSLGHRRLPLIDQLKHSDPRVRVEGLVEMVHMIQANGSSYEALVDSKALPLPQTLAPVLLSLFTDASPDVVKAAVQPEHIDAITQVVPLERIIARIIAIEGTNATQPGNKISALRRLKQSLSDYYVAPALCRCLVAGSSSSSSATNAASRRKVVAGVVAWMNEISERVVDEGNGEIGHDARCYFADMSNFKLYLTRLFPLLSTAPSSSTTYAALVEMLNNLRLVNHVLFEQVLYSFDATVVADVETAIGIASQNEDVGPYDDELDEEHVAVNGQSYEYGEDLGIYGDGDDNAVINTTDDASLSSAATGDVQSTAESGETGMNAAAVATGDATHLSIFEMDDLGDDELYNTSMPAQFDMTVTSFAGANDVNATDMHAQVDGILGAITGANGANGSIGATDSPSSPPDGLSEQFDLASDEARLQTPKTSNLANNDQSSIVILRRGERLPVASPLPAGAADKIDVLQRSLIQLQERTADSMVFRKLMRLAKETAPDTNPQMTESVWGAKGEHFSSLIGASIAMLECEEDVAKKEYCILLVKQLLHCEASYLGDHAGSVLRQLMASRVDSSHAVCSAAEDALDTFVQMVERNVCVLALLDLLESCAAHTPGGVTADAASTTPSTISSLFGLKSNPLATGFVLLSKTLHRHTADSLTTEAITKMVALATEGLNNNVPEVRKSAVDLIVALHAIQGDQLDMHLAHLSVPQRKLVAVYISRSQTVR